LFVSRGLFLSKVCWNVHFVVPSLYPVDLYPAVVASLFAKGAGVISATGAVNTAAEAK
jgi:hypothetical protein